MLMLYAFSILGKKVNFLRIGHSVGFPIDLAFYFFFLVIYSEKFSVGRFSDQVEKEFSIGGQNTILFQDVVQD